MLSIAVIVRFTLVVGIAGNLAVTQRVQVPKVGYPQHNPFPYTHWAPRGDAHVPGPLGQVRAPGNIVPRAVAAESKPTVQAASQAISWDEWGAADWTKLAAAFRASMDESMTAELATVGESLAATTLVAVEATAEKSLEAKSTLTPGQIEEESTAHANGNYGTATASLGRAYSAERVWVSVFRAWAQAVAADGAEKGPAVAAAMTKTASAAELTQKLAAFEPGASGKTAANWAASAKEWQAALAEQKPVAEDLSSRPFPQVMTTATMALIGLFVSGGVVLAVLHFRRSAVTVGVEPFLV